MSKYSTESQEFQYYYIIEKLARFFTSNCGELQPKSANRTCDKFTDWQNLEICERVQILNNADLVTEERQIRQLCKAFQILNLLYLVEWKVQPRQMHLSHQTTPSSNTSQILEDFTVVYFPIICITLLFLVPICTNLQNIQGLRIL